MDLSVMPATAPFNFKIEIFKKRTQKMGNDPPVCQ